MGAVSVYGRLRRNSKCKNKPIKCRKMKGFQSRSFLRAAILFCILAASCAAGSPSPDQDLDFSNAEVCPAGYYHDIVHMTHFSTYPPESVPIPPENRVTDLCPMQIPSPIDTNAKVSCAQGEPQIVELGPHLSPDYVCTCQASPWGISRIYWGSAPSSCLEWQSLSTAQRRARATLLEQRRQALFQKLVTSSTRCFIEDVGDKGFAIRCSPPLQRVTKNDLAAVEAAMPSGCDNLRLARFVGEGRKYDRGFALDCNSP